MSRLATVLCVQETCRTSGEDRADENGPCHQRNCDLGRLHDHQEACRDGEKQEHDDGVNGHQNPFDLLALDGDCTPPQDAVGNQSQEHPAERRQCHIEKHYNSFRHIGALGDKLTLYIIHHI